MPARDWKRVAALAYDGLGTFEFGIVVEVFGLRRTGLNVPWYEFNVCSMERGPIRAAGGIRVQAPKGLRTLREAGTIVVPGWHLDDEAPPVALIGALRSAHAAGARLVSICSGVFLLAATGLLDGKRVTAHWRHVERFRARFPRVQVEPDVLYVDEGSILTSAGSAAGIDLCVHIVRRDYGAEIANEIARRLVMPPHREGGQAQYINTPIRVDPSAGLARVLEWAQSRLDQPLQVQDLARRAAMSARTFARHFREETGTTPHRWLTHQRVMEAQRRLECTDETMEQIAPAVGLRRHYAVTSAGWSARRPRRTANSSLCAGNSGWTLPRSARWTIAAVWRVSAGRRRRWYAGISVMSNITTETRGHVFLIGLSRVEKRNAFDPAMFHDLARAYGAYEADDEMRCAVVFAHGPHFTGGIDLAQFAPLFERNDPFTLESGQIDPFGMRSQLSKPLLIAVHGITFTIGIEMMLAADIRIAASDARFAQLEIARGLYPLGGATFRLVREAGWGNAMRYLLTADEFGAETALRLGLVQEVTEPGRQFDRAVQIAERIAAQAPLGVRATLRSARMGLLEGEGQAAARVREDMPAILASSDFREGLASFRERRTARFLGK